MTDEIAKGCPKYSDPAITCYCDACLDRACDENGVPRITGERWDRSAAIRLVASVLAEGQP